MKYIDKKVHDDKSLKVGEFIDLDLIVTTTKEIANINLNNLGGLYNSNLLLHIQLFTINLSV